MSWFDLNSYDGRHDFTRYTFVYEYLPLALLYYALAVLVLLPNTRILRASLLPFTLYAMIRASVSWDFSYGNPRAVYLNQAIVVIMVSLSVRSIIWACQVGPYKRPGVAHTKTSTKTLLLDAADLLYNMRGIGWDWSEGLRVPPQTLPATSRIAFLSAAFRSLLFHLFWFDTIHFSIQSLAFETVGSPVGGTIIDPNLFLVLRYLRSSYITFMAGFVVYFSMQTAYLTTAIICTGILRQHPSQWPPLFRQPWRSTSLARFWSQRWHQLFRHNFLEFGGKPIAFLTGSTRVGPLFSVFFLSGLLHHAGLWGMGRGSDSVPVVGFFVMNGVGIVLEGVWVGITNKKVDGPYGWLWTMFWMTLWGHGLVDAWCRHGLVGSMFIPEQLRPAALIWKWCTGRDLDEI